MEQINILLVEDNAEEITLTLRALKKNNMGENVTVVHDGAEALDFLFCKNAYANRDPHNLPKLILLDLKLTNIDGLAVLRRLREDQRTRFLPVVMLTSSKAEQDLIEAYQSGTNSYIQKPIDFAQFVESIGKLGSYWLGLNETPPG